MLTIKNDHKWSACPLCLSKDIEYLGKIDYRKPVMFSTHLIELQEVSSICQCGSCKSWFTQNILHENDALELYKNGESNTKWLRQTGFVEEKPRNIVHRLKQYFIEGKRVLDVGCNIGSLLDFAGSKGCYTFGVEPSITSQAILCDKGHRSFSSIDEVRGQFDVITAFDLVEHLHDLLGSIIKFKQLLVEGGVLILLTGDVDSLSARLTKNDWWYLKAPEHIVFPSRQFFRELDDFELLSIDGTYASVGYMKSIFWVLAQYFRKKILLGNYQGLPALGPDHMLVVLRKI
ncbi:MAG: class I SAM-dependent methyltransferase [Burkholderiales bacterium]|nr:class I SAM-dependent methyltransferase [Burkholderiales bacterium]